MVANLAQQRLGVSSLVVGLTVVAMGTSMHELFVSVSSTLKKHGDIAVGSNIFNILGILGVAGIIFSYFPFLAPLTLP